MSPESSGWIKLHRVFADWQWSDNPEMVSLLVHLLILANHGERKWHGILVKPGQLITGRKKLSQITGISEQRIRTCIERLKSTNEITTESTNNFTIITLTKWEQFQHTEKKPTNESTKKPTIKQPTSNQPSTTNKNDNNYKNDKKVPIGNKGLRLLKPDDLVDGKAINQVISVFYELNPAIPYNRNDYRKSASELIRRLGLDATLEIAKIAVQAAMSSDQYAPRITTPVQLQTKLGDLKVYIIKHLNKQLTHLDLNNLWRRKS